MTHILNAAPQQGVFVRGTGHDLRMGAIVEYKLNGFNFKVRITREGVSVAGVLPVVDWEGVGVVIDVLKRAVKHHNHLKSFPLGERQTILDEHDLMTQEAVSDLIAQNEPVTVQ